MIYSNLSDLHKMCHDIETHHGDKPIVGYDAYEDMYFELIVDELADRVIVKFGQPVRSL